MSWKRDNVPENTQSHKDPCAFCAYSDIDVASGASGAVLGIFDDEPMCIDTVVSVSSPPAHTGSHPPPWSSDSAGARGAWGAVLGIFDDEPMCIDTVVSVSSHAVHTGSHAPV